MEQSNTTFLRLIAVNGKRNMKKRAISKHYDTSKRNQVNTDCLFLKGLLTKGIILLAVIQSPEGCQDVVISVLILMSSSHPKIISS